MATNDNIDMSNLVDSKDIKGVGLFIDPFTKNGIEKVTMVIGRPMFGAKGTVAFTATIHFDSGDTSGYHDIKGESFKDLVEKVEQFINNLQA